jgi:ureidoacrylate peracid hydrolase
MSELADFELDPRRVVVLVIDMQNDFCHPDGFFAKAGHDVSACASAVDATRRLLEQVRPLGVGVMWTKSVSAEEPKYKLPPLRFRTSRESTESRSGVGGTNCFAPGAWGSEIVSDLSPEDGDVVVQKARYDAFYRTELERELRSRKIEVVAIAGVTTDCCVDSTARQAFIRDFGVLILSDCVASFKNEWDMHEASLRCLALLFAVITETQDFVDCLKRSSTTLQRSRPQT